MPRPRMIVVAGPPGSGKTRSSVANLRKAVATFGRVRVYDSTARWASPRLVAVARAGRLVRQGKTPGWLDASLADGDA